MTFLTLQSELEARLNAYDSTVAADLVKLKRWLNMGIQYICGKRLWPFQIGEEIVQTVPEYTTGTCGTIAGSTTVTLTSPPTTSKTDYYIQFLSSNDWYKITAHTASSSSMTISPAVINTASAITFRIRKLLYTTTTPFVQILDMKQLVTPSVLTSVNPREADFFLPLYYSAGSVYNYIMSSPSSAGTPQFSLLFAPSTTINIMVRGLKALTDLSADGDIPVIPSSWHDAIVNIAAYYGFTSLDDTRAVTELKIGEERIADMAMVLSHDLGRHRVMRAVDGELNSGLVWALPSTFGPEV